MFDEAVTSILDALALLAVAFGVGLAVAGPWRPGVGVAAAGVTLLSSTVALGLVEGWTARRVAKRGGEGA